jgi:SAM-dependent methyltransferase
MVESTQNRYVDSEYLAANPGWHAEDAPWKARMIHQLWLRTGLPNPGTVAEIGCGSGRILAELQSRFPDSAVYDGFDIAPDAIRMAQKDARKSLSFHCEDLTQSTRTFDALLCIDVFEHVENPFEFLRTIRKLAPIVVFNIPLEMHVAGLLINHQLWTRRHFGHLHYYTAAVAPTSVDWWIIPEASVSTSSGCPASSLHCSARSCPHGCSGVHPCSSWRAAAELRLISCRKCKLLP